MYNLYYVSLLQRHMQRKTVAARRLWVAHRWVLLLLLLAPCALSLLIRRPVRADDTIVALEPETINTQVGSEIEVSVVVRDVESLYGLEIRVLFDASLLQVVDVNPDLDGVQVAEGEFPHPDFVARNEADNADGVVWYVATQLNPRDPANGTGTVTTIRFSATAAGTAFLSFETAQLVDDRAVGMTAGTGGGQVIIASAAGDTPVPPPPTATRTITPSPTPWPSSTTTHAPTIPVPTIDIFSSPTPTGEVTETPWPSDTPRLTDTPRPTDTTQPTWTPPPGATLVPSNTPPPTRQLPTNTPAPAATRPPSDPYAAPTQSTTEVYPAKAVEPTNPQQPQPTEEGSTVLPSDPVTGTESATNSAPPATTGAFTTSTIMPIQAVPKLAFAVPTLIQSNRRTPAQQQARPLVSNGVFVCFGVVLVLFSALLFAYLAHQRRAAGPTAKQE